MQTILVDPGLIRTGSRTTKPALGPARGGFINLGLASAVVAVLGELRTDPRPILDDAGLSHPSSRTDITGSPRRPWADSCRFAWSAPTVRISLSSSVRRSRCPPLASLAR